MFVMLFAVVQAARDFTFSLSGGSTHGKFTLAADGLYAGEFGKFFIQAAGFVNLGQEKEYGGSITLGGTAAEGSDLYLTTGVLSAYGKAWIQLCPTVRFRLPWMSFSAFYALPVFNPTVQVDGQEICAAQYWGGELNIVPVPWARIYGDLFSVNKAFNFKLGAEVRPIKWISVSAEWNKAGSGIYSQWNNQDFRIAISFLLGNQQQGFPPTTQRVQVVPMYPILTRKVNSVPEVTAGEVEIQYRRVKPIIYPNAGGVGVAVTYHNVYKGQNATGLIQTSESTWVSTIYLQCNPTPYLIWLYDTKVSKEPVGYEVSVRLKGDLQWFLLTRVVVNPFHPEGEAVQMIFNKGTFAN